MIFKPFNENEFIHGTVFKEGLQNLDVHHGNFVLRAVYEKTTDTLYIREIIFEKL